MSKYPNITEHPVLFSIKKAVRLVLWEVNEQYVIWRRDWRIFRGSEERNERERENLCRYFVMQTTKGEKERGAQAATRQYWSYCDTALWSVNSITITDSYHLYKYQEGKLFSWAKLWRILYLRIVIASNNHCIGECSQKRHWEKHNYFRRRGEVGIWGSSMFSSEKKEGRKEC